jgi:FixJ family two-component response regulator
MANPPLISVVDDDNSVRESIQSLVRSVGFAVKVFASAEEFWSWDHLQDTDCLILDVRMPGMSGIELQRRLIANHPEIPIIFITAHSSEEEVRSLALRNGAAAYLAKPLSEEALLNAVHLALNKENNGLSKTGMK